MNNVVTADQFVAGLGTVEGTTKLDELRAAISRVRGSVARNVRKLDRMRMNAEKRALRAETDSLRKRHDEMWNAAALCQSKPIDGKPNHYGIRDEVECEEMATELLAKYRQAGWI